MGVAQIQVTHSTDATVYVALDLAIIAAAVVRCGAGWETRCYYGPGEYDATIATSRETAENDALRYAFRIAGPADERQVRGLVRPGAYPWRQRVVRRCAGVRR